ncbi:MAG: hypothetical protein NUV98_06050, partial [Candidatus Roizmanbacteria bacterium]|nr:hypothetical protein [Candidatus Roizmanbacteria bacterium]
YNYTQNVLRKLHLTIPRIFVFIALILAFLYFDMPLYFGKCDSMMFANTTDGGYVTYSSEWGFLEVFSPCKPSFVNLGRIGISLSLFYLFSAFLDLSINKNFLLSLSAFLLLSILPLAPHKYYHLSYRGTEQLEYSEEFILESLLYAPEYFNGVEYFLQEEPQFRQKLQQNRTINSVLFLGYFCLTGYGSFLFGKWYSQKSKKKK